MLDMIIDASTTNGIGVCTVCSKREEQPTFGHVYKKIILMCKKCAALFTNSLLVRLEDSPIESVLYVKNFQN